MIALALYRHRSISEVVDELDLALPTPQASFVSKSAIAQAQQRTCAAPLAWLFHESARNWVAQDQAKYLFKGFALFAMDGTTLQTADSAANRKHFGASAATHDRVGSSPQLRAVTLTAIVTGLVRDAIRSCACAFRRRHERNARNYPNSGRLALCLPSMSAAGNGSY
ncbi:hypothetical protein HDG38_004120 [Paraburkholderia sp. WSM4177]|nr:hypothetical protein [Paraburkholderia sp. WSM4177]MBB5486031.1 hypothetical protein [Paraburkholderia sp. WSM4180]